MAIATFEEIRHKKKVPSFKELRGTVPSFEEIRTSVEPTAEDLEKYRRMGVKQYRSPAGKLYDLTEPETEPIGFLEGFFEDIERKVPFTPVVAKDIETARAASRLQKDEYKLAFEKRNNIFKILSDKGILPKWLAPKWDVEDERAADVKKVEEYINRIEEKEKRGYTGWGKFGAGVSILPRWMIEFALTGGLKKIGSSATRKFLDKRVKSELAKRGASWIVGSAVRTTAGLPHRVGEEIVERRMREEPENWATSVAKGWGEVFVEAASEEAGGAMTSFGKKYLGKAIGKMPFGKKFLNGLYTFWKKTRPQGTWAAFMNSITKKGGYSNLIGEYGEERLATLMHSILKTEDFGAGPDSSRWDRLKAGFASDFEGTNILVELGVLSVPGAVRFGLGRIGTKAQKERSEALKANINATIEAIREEGRLTREERTTAELEIDEMDAELAQIQRTARLQGQKPAEVAPVAPVAEEKPLFIPLRTEYYDKFVSGEKQTEMREEGPRWNDKTVYVGRKVTISKGYGKTGRLTGVVVKTWVEENSTNEDFVSIYGERKTARHIQIRLEAKEKEAPTPSALKEKPAKPTRKEKLAEEKSLERELSGISRQKRSKLVRDVEAEIEKSDIYQATLDSVETEAGVIGPGYYYVPEKFRSEVEDIIGKKKGAGTKLQQMFAFKPTDKRIVKLPTGEKAEIGPTDWTRAVQETLGRGREGVEETIGYMDIADFVQRVKDSFESGEEAGRLNLRALEAAAESGDPYTVMLAEKHRLLRGGATAQQIDDMIREWAEYNKVDISAIEDEFVGDEALRLKEIKAITDEAEREKQLDLLAEENVTKRMRAEAAQAVKEVLKDNDVEAEVWEVEEIEEEDLPFERRGKPTGAAVITPSGEQIVLLAYGADSETGYHEGYHILRRRLTDRDIKILDKRYKGDEEAEAADFAVFVKQNKAPNSIIRVIWNKLKAILQKIKSGLEGKGFRTIEDIYRGLAGGRIALADLPVRGFATAYQRGVFGQPIEEQLRLPFKERQRAIKRVEAEEKKPTKVVPEADAKRGYYRTKAGQTIENPATLKDEDLSLEQLLQISPDTTITAKFYGRRGGAARHKIKVKNIILPKPKGKPYAHWRPKGRVKIKSKLIKGVDNEIEKSMKPRSNAVQITPEQIAAKMGALYMPDYFYNPVNPLPEIQEAFNQLVKGGPLFDIRYEREPVFYSKLERLVTDKMPAKMDAEQFKRWLVKQGIKADEMKWSGVNELTGKITKQQVLDTIAANNIQIEEVEKGDEETNYAQERMTRIEQQLENKQISEQDKEKLRLEYKKIADEIREKTPTKFQQYVIPGGEKYRELLLRLPQYVPDWAEKITVQRHGSGWSVYRGGQRISTTLTRQAAEEQQVRDVEEQRKTEGVFRGAHWEETNVLAHVRFDDRTDAQGKRVLFIEEIQSDWHQAGRRKGYAEKLEPLTELPEHMKVEKYKKSYRVWTETTDGKPAVLTGFWTTRQKAIDAALKKLNKARKRESQLDLGYVPDAPFKKTWQELALKRMLRYAVENDYDKLAWTTGEQQAERYDLSKLIESVNVIKGKLGISLTVTTKEGQNVIDSKLVQPNELDNIIGKELADKIRQQKEPEHTYSGLDLKVGGEGMKSFYDRIVPQFLNKYTKKWGGRVGETKLEIPSEVSKLPWQVYADNELYDAFRTREQATEFIDSQEGTIPGLGGEELKLELVYEAEAVPETVPSLAITPSMEKSVMAGQVMFETSRERLERDLYKKAAKNAEKARLKAIGGLKKKKKVSRRKRIKINIRDTTPVLRDDLKPLEVPPAIEPQKKAVKPTYFSDEWYKENIKKQRGNWLGKFKSTGKRIFLTGEKILTSSSTRLYNISPELFRQTRRYIYDVLNRTADMTDAIEPFLKATKKMSRTDRKQLDLALKNSDSRKITEMVAKYKIQEQFAQAREVLDEIFDAAKEVGIDIEYHREYWHRHIKDPQGFLEYFQGREDWSIIEEAIKRRAERAGRKIEDLTEDEKAQVVNTLLRGFRTKALTLARPGAAKERTVDVVWSDIDQFYDNFSTSIMKYIKLMNAKIAEREFFGRETKEIQKLRALQSARLTRLIKLKKRQGLKPGTTEPQYKENLVTATETWKADSERLERLTNRSPKDTIGGYVYDLVRQGQISPTQEKQIQDVLTGIFAPKGMRWGTGVLASAIYLDTLNSPIQALTQLDEFSYAFYRSPLRSIPAAIRTAFRRSKIEPKDIGIRIIGEEFRGPSMKRALTLLLKSTGFELVDRLNKENYINTVLSKYQAQARSKKEKPALVKRLARVFGKDYKKVLEDLQRPIKSLDDVSDEVKYLLFNEILDIQPIAISEMPEAYNKAGNFRLLYTLKTFYIKRLDFMRNECLKDMMSAKTFLRGFSKLVWLAFAFALFGAVSDFLKDWLKGRAFDLKDSIVDNMLRMIMSSKWQVGQISKKGLGRALLEPWIPPTKLPDEISKDVSTIAKGKERGFELWRSVPVVGELYYWWFGRGREKIEAKEETSWVD